VSLGPGIFDNGEKKSRYISRPARYVIVKRAAIRTGRTPTMNVAIAIVDEMYYRSGKVKHQIYEGVNLSLS
jgi:hypothetical protein